LIGGVEVIANGDIVSKLALVIKDDKGNKVTRKNNYLERGDTVFVETVKSAEQFQLISGKIKAVIDSRDESVRGFKTSMNLISEKIKERINLEHAKGASLPVLRLSSEYTGTGSLAIEHLSSDLKAGDRLLFGNGGVFTVANDAEIGAKELTGSFVGDSPLAPISASFATVKTPPLPNSNRSPAFKSLDRCSIANDPVPVYSDDNLRTGRDAPLACSKFMRSLIFSEIRFIDVLNPRTDSSRESMTALILPDIS
jgi:hypothetical protein